MRNQKGNAFVYILIAVALFAALTFVLARQEDSKETGTLDEETAKLHANQLLNVTPQIKGALDQMLFSGTTVDELDFTKPDESGFETDTLDKVFHPDGGGVVLQPLPKNAIAAGAISDPEPGWYLGRFNHVEWTPSTNNDIILTAYGLSEEVCAQLNMSLIGTRTIPILNTDIPSLLIDDMDHTGSNSDFMDANCPSGDCEGNASLCVQNSAQNRYAFYNVLFGH